MGARAWARRVTRAGALAGALAGVGSMAWGAPEAAAGAVPAAGPPGCHGREEPALARLAARVARESLYVSWAKPDCLDYVVDACHSRSVEVSIHENHVERCGGDPATSPRVDSFRVWRKGERIDWYDIVDAAWRPFDQVHSKGGR